MAKNLKESLRKDMIQQLLDLGISYVDGQPVQKMDYHTVRHLLVMARIKNE